MNERGVRCALMFGRSDYEAAWVSVRRLVIGVLVVAIAAAGTAIAATRGDGSHASRRSLAQVHDQAASKALALWSAFPATARPRPVVVLPGFGIVSLPGSSSEDDAIYQARLTFSAPPAADVAAARKRGLVPAAQAIHVLRKLRHAPHPTGTLRVQVHLGQASFFTDRGRRRLSAWRFSFEHLAQPASVLAVTPYNSPATRKLDPDPGALASSDSSQAVISGHGRTLRIFFIGGPAGHGPCDDSYSGRVFESPHAVTYIITEPPRSGPPRVVICPAYGVTRSVVVHLRQPLAGRVLVASVDGGVIPVARRLTFR